MREKIIYLLTNVSRGSYLSEMLHENFLQGLSIKDESLLHYTVYGTVENRILIDWWIRRYSKKKFERIQERILEILRFSIYQMIFMDSVPDYAILNEANKLAGKQAAPYVNGVLRSLQRDRRRLVDGLENMEPWIRYSINPNLYDLLSQEYSKKNLKRLLKSFHQKDDLVIRINSRDRDRVKESLLKKKYLLEEVPYLEDAVIVANPRGIFSSKEFLEGEITVQKGGSILASHLLDPQEGDQVLDLCAAPGGKTAHLSFLMDNTGLIQANDLHLSKKSRMKENFKRLGVENVHMSFQDARKHNPAWVGKYDRILLDVPCSGLGRIKQYPEIKLFRTSNDILKLQQIQREIIDQAVQYLKPGGYLVYSTCTITRAENQEQKDYLSKQLIEQKVECFKGKESFIQTMPYSKGMGGFFLCKFKKDLK